MATLLMPILGEGAVPDTSGNVYPEVLLNLLTNDLYPHIVFVFKDSGTKCEIHGSFRVPQNYVGTAKIVAEVAANATTGNVVTDFDYRAIADGESLDPSTDQENVTATTTMPGTAWLRKDIEMALTSANLAVGDRVEFSFGRDGAVGGGATDTLAAAMVLFGLYFKYNDA
jgi:hypothetical protein